MLSDSFKLERVVRQQGIISPRLFNLYVVDLIVEPSSMKVGCRVDDVSVNSISYADDIMLLSPKVFICYRLVYGMHAHVHGVLYNVNKIEFLVFRAVGGKGPSHVPKTALNGVELKRVNQFT